jgi:hypothetical protein
LKPHIEDLKILPSNEQVELKNVKFIPFSNQPVKQISEKRHFEFILPKPILIQNESNNTNATIPQIEENDSAIDVIALVCEKIPSLN